MNISFLGCGLYTCTGYAGSGRGLLTLVHGGVDKTRYLVLVCDEDVRREEMGSPGQYGVRVEGAGQDAARDGHYLTWVWGRVAYIGRWRGRERQESKDTGRGGGEEGEGEGGGRGGRERGRGGRRGR